MDLLELIAVEVDTLDFRRLDLDSSEIGLTLNGAEFSEWEEDFIHMDLVVRPRAV